MSDHAAITSRHSTAAISERVSVDISLRSLTNGPRVLKHYNLFGFGNQIDAAASERVATRQAFQRQPGTVARAVKLDGGSGILRAGRVEFAGAGH